MFVWLWGALGCCSQLLLLDGSILRLVDLLVGPHPFARAMSLLTIVLNYLGGQRLRRVAWQVLHMLGVSVCPL